MGIYIDTSLIYHAYSPIDQSDLADLVLDHINFTKKRINNQSI
jgi:hypothetical protein